MTIFDSSPVSNYSTPSCRLKAGGSATGVPWNPTPTRAQPAGIIIAIGSNQPDPHWGNPADIVACCVRLMPSYGLAVVRHSRILVTAHVPAPTQADRDDAPTIAPNPIHRFPDYHNAVVEIATPLPPPDLMTLLHEIERDFGRTRPWFHAPRTLDLDLLVWNGQVSVPGGWPILPHPALYERPFIQTLLQDMMGAEFGDESGQGANPPAIESGNWQELTQ